MMGDPPQSPNGHGPTGVTPLEVVRHPGVMTRLAAWLIGAAGLLRKHLLAPLRAHARNADDRLERTADRFLRRDVNRSRGDDGHTR
jgi:hypothetical protein